MLGLLSKSDYSGYALKRMMAKTSSVYGSESNAQIYPVLKKLEQLKLVCSTLDEASGARHKRVFAITEKGMQALKQWLESDCELALYREEFLLQLSLGQHLSSPSLKRKLEVYQHSTLEKLKQVNDIINHIKQDHAEKADQPYLLLTYDHIKTVIEAKITWCEKVLKNNFTV